MTDETVDIEEVKSLIGALEHEMEMAMAVYDRDTANDLYQHQQRLYRLLPGGDQPVVGGGGVTV